MSSPMMSWERLPSLLVKFVEAVLSELELSSLELVEEELLEVLPEHPVNRHKLKSPANRAAETRRCCFIFCTLLSWNGFLGAAGPTGRENGL